MAGPESKMPDIRMRFTTRASNSVMPKLGFADRAKFASGLRGIASVLPEAQLRDILRSSGILKPAFNGTIFELQPENIRTLTTRSRLETSLWKIERQAQLLPVTPFDPQTMQMPDGLSGMDNLSRLLVGLQVEKQARDITNSTSVKSAMDLANKMANARTEHTSDTRADAQKILSGAKAALSIVSSETSAKVITLITVLEAKLEIRDLTDEDNREISKVLSDINDLVLAFQTPNEPDSAHLALKVGPILSMILSVGLVGSTLMLGKQVGYTNLDRTFYFVAVTSLGLYAAMASNFMKIMLESEGISNLEFTQGPIAYKDLPREITKRFSNGGFPGGIGALLQDFYLNARFGNHDVVLNNDPNNSCFQSTYGDTREIHRVEKRTALIERELRKLRLFDDNLNGDSQYRRMAAVMAMGERDVQSHYSMLEATQAAGIHLGKVTRLLFKVGERGGEYAALDAFNNLVKEKAPSAIAIMPHIIPILDRMGLGYFLGEKFNSTVMSIAESINMPPTIRAELKTALESGSKSEYAFKALINSAIESKIDRARAEKWAELFIARVKSESNMREITEAAKRILNRENIDDRFALMRQIMEEFTLSFDQAKSVVEKLEANRTLEFDARALNRDQNVPAEVRAQARTLANAIMFGERTSDERVHEEGNFTQIAINAGITEPEGSYLRTLLSNLPPDFLTNNRKGQMAKRLFISFIAKGIGEKTAQVLADKVLEIAAEEFNKRFSAENWKRAIESDPTRYYWELDSKLFREMIESVEARTRTIMSDPTTNGIESLSMEKADRIVDIITEALTLHQGILNRTTDGFLSQICEEADGISHIAGAFAGATGTAALQTKINSQKDSLEKAKKGLAKALKATDDAVALSKVAPVFKLIDLFLKKGSGFMRAVGRFQDGHLLSFDSLASQIPDILFGEDRLHRTMLDKRSRYEAGTFQEYNIAIGIVGPSDFIPILNEVPKRILRILIECGCANESGGITNDYSSKQKIAIFRKAYQDAILPPEIVAKVFDILENAKGGIVKFESFAEFNEYQAIIWNALIASKCVNKDKGIIDDKFAQKVAAFEKQFQLPIDTETQIFKVLEKCKSENKRINIESFAEFEILQALTAAKLVDGSNGLIDLEFTGKMKDFRGKLVLPRETEAQVFKILGDALNGQAQMIAELRPLLKDHNTAETRKAIIEYIRVRQAQQTTREETQNLVREISRTVSPTDNRVARIVEIRIELRTHQTPKQEERLLRELHALESQIAQTREKVQEVTVIPFADIIIEEIEGTISRSTILKQVPDIKNRLNLFFENPDDDYLVFKQISEETINAANQKDLNHPISMEQGQILLSIYQKEYQKDDMDPLSARITRRITDITMRMLSKEGGTGALTKPFRALTEAAVAGRKKQETIESGERTKGVLWSTSLFFERMSDVRRKGSKGANNDSGLGFTLEERVGVKLYSVIERMVQDKIGIPPEILAGIYRDFCDEIKLSRDFTEDQRIKELLEITPEKIALHLITRISAGETAVAALRELEEAWTADPRLSEEQRRIIRAKISELSPIASEVAVRVRGHEVLGFVVAKRRQAINANTTTPNKRAERYVELANTHTTANELIASYGNLSASEIKTLEREATLLAKRLKKNAAIISEINQWHQRRLRALGAAVPSAGTDERVVYDAKAKALLEEKNMRIDRLSLFHPEMEWYLIPILDQPMSNGDRVKQFIGEKVQERRREFIIAEELTAEELAARSMTLTNNRMPMRKIENGTVQEYGLEFLKQARAIDGALNKRSLYGTDLKESVEELKIAARFINANKFEIPIEVERDVVRDVDTDNFLFESSQRKASAYWQKRNGKLLRSYSAVLQTQQYYPETNSRLSSTQNYMGVLYSTVLGKTYGKRGKQVIMGCYIVKNRKALAEATDWVEIPFLKRQEDDLYDDHLSYNYQNYSRNNAVTNYKNHKLISKAALAATALGIGGIVAFGSPALAIAGGFGILIGVSKYLLTKNYERRFTRMLGYGLLGGVGYGLLGGAGTLGILAIGAGLASAGVPLLIGAGIGAVARSMNIWAQKEGGHKFSKLLIPIAIAGAAAATPLAAVGAYFGSHHVEELIHLPYHFGIDRRRALADRLGINSASSLGRWLLQRQKMVRMYEEEECYSQPDDVEDFGSSLAIFQRGYHADYHQSIDGVSDDVKQKAALDGQRFRWHGGMEGNLRPAISAFIWDRQAMEDVDWVRYILQTLGPAGSFPRLALNINLWAFIGLGVTAFQFGSNPDEIVRTLLICAGLSVANYATFMFTLRKAMTIYGSIKSKTSDMMAILDSLSPGNIAQGVRRIFYGETPPFTPTKTPHETISTPIGNWPVRWFPFPPLVQYDKGGVDYTVANLKFKHEIFNKVVETTGLGKLIGSGDKILTSAVQSLRIRAAYGLGTIGVAIYGIPGLLTPDWLSKVGDLGRSISEILGPDWVGKIGDFGRAIPEMLSQDWEKSAFMLGLAIWTLIPFSLARRSLKVIKEGASSYETYDKVKKPKSEARSSAKVEAARTALLKKGLGKSGAPKSLKKLVNQ